MAETYLSVGSDLTWESPNYWEHDSYLDPVTGCSLNGPTRQWLVTLVGVHGEEKTAEFMNKIVEEILAGEFSPSSKAHSHLIPSDDEVA